MSTDYFMQKVVDTYPAWLYAVRTIKKGFNNMTSDPATLDAAAKIIEAAFADMKRRVYETLGALEALDADECAEQFRQAANSAESNLVIDTIIGWRNDLTDAEEDHRHGKLAADRELARNLRTEP